MSRSNRTRSYDGKTVKADDYFTNGEFEVARFGENVVLKNNRTPEQQEEVMKYLCSKYHEEHTQITEMVHALKEKVLDCNPYDLLMYLRSQAILSQLNITSEREYSTEANALIHAQEFIQSILVSAPLHNNSATSSKEELYSQIVEDYLVLHKRIMFFYCYWSAYIQRTNGTRDELIREIVEAQYMYWVRGNRYQIFELEPLRALLPPHNDILNELFGVTAVEIISGLEKLRYSLSQGYADAFMDLGKEFEQFCQAVDSGLDPEKIRADTAERSSKIIGQVFGSDLINVKAITGWDDRFIKMLSAELNEQSSFWGTEEFSGWPIVDLPVMKKPFISIDGTAYAFLYYALFDNIYRNIQKGIMRLKPTYLEQWKASQTKVSEEMVRDLFLKLLPGAKSHIGNYYPKGTSLKQLNENDIIITYHGFLFIIEVKAGSFPTTPPITDFSAHIEAYKKLAEAADSQCSRTLSYIMRQSNAQFYDREKNPTFQLPQLASFEDVFTFSVTVDNFNSFAARAEKSNVISLKEETIVISYDDLLVYAAYFDSPISFLHYLKQRKSAMRVPKYQMYDEFDHLGLYIFRNQYALNPSQYGGVKEVHWAGFRQEIDEYFNWLYTDPSKAHKPVQQIPELISEIVAYLDKDTSSEKIRLAHFLLDLCTDSKNEFAEKIRYCKVRQKEIQRNVPIMSFGDVKYCAFITVPGVKPLSSQEQIDYSYAAASRNETLPVMWISLEYDANDKLVTASGRECRFSDLKGVDIERIKRFGELKAQDWVKLYLLKNKEIGRNDICPCGSGKKYKKCCGK